MNIGSVDPNFTALAGPEMHNLLLIRKHLVHTRGILLPSKADKPKFAYNLFELLPIKTLMLLDKSSTQFDLN
jgi:hypothetical protein